MNRNQRRYKYKRPKSSEAKKNKNVSEEAAAVRTRHPMHSRCCYVTPDQSSFAQLTNKSSPTQYGVESSVDLQKSPIPDLNQVAEPIQPEIITIAKPKRFSHPGLMTIASPKAPILPDMGAMPKSKRSFRQTLSKTNRKGHPFRSLRPDMVIIKPFRPTRPEVGTVTDPYIPSAVPLAEPVKQGLPDLTISQLQELRKVFFPPCFKTEKASQYTSPFEFESSYEEMIQSHSMDNSDEIDKILMRGRDEETLTQYHNLPKNIHISEVPLIKLMAVKFTKYKKDNIELRRVEEKVVCVEYDVFDKEVDENTPVQKMRAFFSIKPLAEGKEAKVLTELPPTIKSKFNISAGDLQKFSQKEIEIIDGKILDNQPYLDDLRKLIRRKENTQNNKNTPNLRALYDMGKRDLLDLNTNFDRNTMPKEELVEMQNLILRNCKSSVHGIRRRTLKNNSKCFDEMAQNSISRSLISELLKESNKNFADL